MKRFKGLVIAFGVVVGMGAAMLPVPAGAIDVYQGCSDAQSVTGSSDSIVCKGKTDQASSFVKKLVNVLLYILGAISVVVIIIAGILYTTSTGDAGRIKKAKDALTYAIVGLIVAALAYAIVNFVVGSL